MISRLIAWHPIPWTYHLAPLLLSLLEHWLRNVSIKLPKALVLIILKIINLLDEPLQVIDVSEDLPPQLLQLVLGVAFLLGFLVLLD